MNEELGLRVFFGSLIAIVSYIFNTLGPIFWILIFCMLCDIVTGVIRAWDTQEFLSSIAREGIAKKFGILIIVIMSVLLDFIAEEYGGLSTHDSIYIITTSSYIGIEGTSVIENLAAMGVKTPKVIKKGLKILKGKKEEEIEKEED